MEPYTMAKGVIKLAVKVSNAPHQAQVDANFVVFDSPWPQKIKRNKEVDEGCHVIHCPPKVRDATTTQSANL